MAFLKVSQYQPPSTPYPFWIIIQLILIFLPAVTLVYLSNSKLLNLEYGYDIILIIFLLMAPLFFSLPIDWIIKNVKYWLLDRQLKLNPIKLFIPSNTTTNNYLPYHPSTLILKEGEGEMATYPTQDKNTFLLLNSLPYDNTDIIEPYYRMIVCKKLLNNESILWGYFIIIFFLISLVTSIYSFTIAITIERCIPQELLWVQILSFFTFLSVFFGFMLYKFIQNIPMEKCSTSDIISNIRKDMRHIILNFKDKKDLDREFSIYENGKFFSQKEALESINEIDKNILDKLKNIFQITAPIFYLSNITIGMLYLTKFTEG